MENEENNSDLRSRINEIRNKKLPGPFKETAETGQGDGNKVLVAVAPTSKKPRVLVVGVGRLGRSCLAGLAKTKIGQLTIIDYNDVNLHSAAEQLKSSNSELNIVQMNMHLNCMTINMLYKDDHLNFDVVVDGSNNLDTTYILNKGCAKGKIPLVSGKISRWEGQVAVCNYMSQPCYRCLFPKPPRPHTITSDNEGILGPVCGLIGAVAALEVIKILGRKSNVMCGALKFYQATYTFTKIKIKRRNLYCPVCGEFPSHASFIDKLKTIKAKEILDVIYLNNSVGKTILDVRTPFDFAMSHIHGSVNVPFDDLSDSEILGELEETVFKALSKQQVYVLCKDGGDSQNAIYLLKMQLPHLEIKFIHIKDGLDAYTAAVDSLLYDDGGFGSDTDDADDCLLFDDDYE